jgi:hypothetical protein
MKTYTVNGTYGSGKTPCSVFVMQDRFGAFWYAVDGSQNVNCTYEDIANGVDVEELSDIDTFTWGYGINSEEDLETAVNA